MFVQETVLGTNRISRINMAPQPRKCPATRFTSCTPAALYPQTTTLSTPGKEE